MNWVQNADPNLSVTGKSGYCLSMQEDVWGAIHNYDYAEQAWNNSGAANHPGELPPDDVCVLVYWTYYDTTDKAEYGHVATWVPGRGVYSSTFNTVYGAEWYASIQAMTNRINQIRGANSKYLGWSEVISNIRVVKPQEDTMKTAIPPEIVAQHYANFTAGLVKITASDPAAQNRFEDTADDEFWYGLCFQLKDLLDQQYHRAEDLQKQVDAGKGGVDEAAKKLQAIKDALA
jgi:hypothetical protein